jgi:hypothetical protein
VAEAVLVFAVVNDGEDDTVLVLLLVCDCDIEVDDVCVLETILLIVIDVLFVELKDGGVVMENDVEPVEVFEGLIVLV